MWAWRAVAAAVLGVGVAGGCAGKQPAAAPGGGPQAPAAAADAGVQAPPVQTGPAQTLDLNRDGRPDTWSHAVPGEDGAEPRLVRKELDLDFDGRIDVTRHYDAQGRLEREVADLDFDGTVDVVHLWEADARLRTEEDTNGDGRMDTWTHYLRNEVVRREVDRNRDGRVDQWVLWEGDQVARTGEDTDGDGAADRWTPNPNVTPAPAPRGAPAPGGEKVGVEEPSPAPDAGTRGAP